MYDGRVRDLLDFSLYLDISDEVKLNWKIQRDMEERGHSLESILASIEARKPDFDAYIAPQKEFADLTIEVLPTQLDPDDNVTLRVLYIQKTENDYDPCYILDEGSTIEWTPCGKKLSCSYPGIKFSSGPDFYYGKEVHVLEMDGTFGNIEEIEYVEKYLSSSKTKFDGELTKSITNLGNVPGNDNGTGLMQTLASFAIRALYEKKSGIESKSSLN